MSQQLINHNTDIHTLQNEGYEVEIKGGYICIHHIPYVNFEKEIKYGTLFSPYQTVPGSDVIAKPSDHVMHFIGEKPCHTDGKPILAIEYQNRQILSKDFIADFSFSNKPKNAFENFYDKFTSYIRVISYEAISLDETGTVTAKTFKPVIITESETPFVYLDSNSSRARIDFLNEKLTGMKIAIIGLGGTGSYILDLVSKTPVSQIHLFDSDTFESHNAFRFPGAASVDDLTGRIQKVEYLSGIYSKMHRGIVPHCEIISKLNISELDNMDFVFICIDRNDARNLITKYLLSKEIPFIDAGLGVNIQNEKLVGATRISYNQQVGSEYNEVAENQYNSNIQIAELNMFNATQAVIKWKQHYGFYNGQLNQASSHFIIEKSKIFHDEN
ncbi:ThiF family adenylyltransferase [Chryseobacterium gambrini]|uniref:ThiF family adenylyltransferase n=1 Tax=Chryseobacterium gambrini TaxID=373672 RepID=A0ABM8K8R6_9FLAO|nr:ThiF family adenylyltransferase [Chryseobacterium gambrini]